MLKLQKLKNLLTVTNYGGCLPYGPYYAVTQFLIGDNLKELPKEELKENFRESIPGCNDELCVKELSEDMWTKEIAAQNQPAKVVLRVNTLKTTKQKLRSILMDENIETELLKDYPDALMLKERTNVFL